MKILIVLILLFIVYSLGLAMFYLIREKGQGKNTLRFLTVRIIISLALFGLIVLAIKMGWVQPHGIFPDNTLPLRLLNSDTDTTESILFELHCKSITGFCTDFIGWTTGMQDGSVKNHQPPGFR